MFHSSFFIPLLDQIAKLSEALAVPKSLDDVGSNYFAGGLSAELLNLKKGFWKSSQTVATVTASVSTAAFIVLMKTTRVARGPFAADCDSIAACGLVQTRIYQPPPSPIPPRPTPELSLATSIYLLSDTLKHFPATPRIRLFPHITPHRSFSAVQNNLWG